MQVVGIETSSPITSVVLWRDGEEVAREVSAEARNHVEFLMPAIMRVTGERIDAVDAIAVGLGPGLFTSMRVGIATAKTLAATAGIPIVGVMSLDALARPYLTKAATVVSCVNAFRREVFIARYDDGARTDGPRAVVPTDLVQDITGVEDLLVVGDGPAMYPDAFAGLATLDAVPDATDVVALAWDRVVAGDHDDALHLEPLYVRRSDAEIKWDARGVVIERPMRVRFREPDPAAER